MFILFASFSTTQQQQEFEMGAHNCNEYFIDTSSSEQHMAL